MSHPEHAARDGDGGISGGAGASDCADFWHVTGPKFQARDGGCPTCGEWGAVAPGEWRAAAYRAGMLRAAEIAETEGSEPHGVEGGSWLCSMVAAQIRAEAAAGTPPDTERQ